MNKGPCVLVRWASNDKMFGECVEIPLGALVRFSARDNCASELEKDMH